MTSNDGERVNQMLSDEHVTSYEIAKNVEVTDKTAMKDRMHSKLRKDDIRYKNSGGIHLFWNVFDQRRT